MLILSSGGRRTRVFFSLSSLLWAFAFNLKIEHRDLQVNAIEKALIFDPHLGVHCTKYGISYAAQNVQYLKLTSCVQCTRCIVISCIFALFYLNNSSGFPCERELEDPAAVWHL